MLPFTTHVVLVKSLYDANIGAASRAMANMGAENLILISRQCEVTLQAQKAAATGQRALQQRREYSSWDDFFRHEPDGLRLAFSARDGRQRPVWDFAQRLRWLQKENLVPAQSENDLRPVYLIFGAEDHGLTNEELELAHYCVRLPTFGENSCLNLAQAVLLALFILRSEWGAENTAEVPRRQPSPSGKVFPEESLKIWLQEMGFDLGKPVNAYSVLRRMLLHNVPTAKELEMLETILQQSTRKLREYNELRKLYTQGTEKIIARYPTKPNSV